jgi:putative flippase GtrA
MHTHYLLAAAAALEMTLLHNFLWHCNYTWRDRQMLDTRGRMFVRYHLSSGVISMLGNLAMMRLLVQQAHLPVLVADVGAILCCSILNFFAGNSWAFAPTQAASAKGE